MGQKERCYMALVLVDRCESCGRLKGEKHKITMPSPSIEQLEEWMLDSICEATDGCIVEPDGICSHGHSSWLLRMGLI